MNQNVKNLIQKLGEAIHESVSESEHIAGVVRNIREQGFDVLLMLEATIGLNEVGSDAEIDSDSDSDGISVPGGARHLLTDGNPVEGPFTDHDLNFLKSLRITLTEADSSDSHIETGEGRVED